MEERQNNYIARKQFMEAVAKVWNPIVQLNTAWEKLSIEDNGETSVNYPFNGSFNEWVYEFAHWYNELSKKFYLKTDGFMPTITVKDLKDILNQIDEDTQIVVATQDKSWWLNVTSVELPNEDNGCFTLTFHTENNFDTRQF